MDTFALHDYESVLAIAEEGHFGRAARRLKVTQPALSARVRRIEEGLGVRLFERDRSGVTITPAGSVFVEGADRIVTAARETARAARQAHAGFGQTVRIGMTQTAAYQILVPALNAFRQSHAHVKIRLHQDNTSSLERGLEQNALDVAFLHPPLHAPGLTDKVLVRVPMALFDAHPEATEDRPLIHYPRAQAPVLMGALMRRDLADETDYPAAEADTMLGAIVLSRAGFGPMVVPEDYPSPFGEDPACKLRTETGIVLETAVARRSLDRRPIIQQLIDCAVAAAG